MPPLGPPLLAGVTSLLVTFLSLVTSECPRTFFLIKKSGALYAYVLIYGLLGFLLMILLKFIKPGTIQAGGFTLSNPWLQAFGVGLGTKALLHIRIFSLPYGSQAFPVGLETVTLVFEPWLLRQIKLDHYNAIQSFLSPRAVKYSDIADVKTRIKRNIAPIFNQAERAAFEIDVEKTSEITDAMALYLSYFGRANFDRVFPP